MDLNIAMQPTLLPQQELLQAKPLVGFDHGEHIYHVMLFEAGGGAIGIWREGSNFCARITLDSLVAFAEQAHFASQNAGAGSKQ